MKEKGEKRKEKGGEGYFSPPWLKFRSATVSQWLFDRAYTRIGNF